NHLTRVRDQWAAAIAWVHRSIGLNQLAARDALDHERSLDPGHRPTGDAERKPEREADRRDVLADSGRTTREVEVKSADWTFASDESAISSCARADPRSVTDNPSVLLKRETRGASDHVLDRRNQSRRNQHACPKPLPLAAVGADLENAAANLRDQIGKGLPVRSFIRSTSSDVGREKGHHGKQAYPAQVP